MFKADTIAKMNYTASRLRFVRSYTVRQFAIEANVSFRTAYRYWHMAHSARLGITGLLEDGKMVFRARSNRMGHLVNNNG
jgi:hypothetical protein